jgi:hypothetical protein
MYDLADITLRDSLGIVGALLYLLAYSAVQIGHLDGNSASYTLVNTLAAGLVLLGLTENFNLAAVIIQTSWLLIGACRLVYAFGTSSFTWRWSHGRQALPCSTND